MVGSLLMAVSGIWFYQALDSEPAFLTDDLLAARMHVTRRPGARFASACFVTGAAMVIDGSASIVGTLTIPIYEGGQIYARTRQAKETAGQRRIEVDTQRDTVRAAVVSAWGGHEAAKAQIVAAQIGPAA